MNLIDSAHLLYRNARLEHRIPERWKIGRETVVSLILEVPADDMRAPRLASHDGAPPGLELMGLPVEETSDPEWLELVDRPA